MGGNLAKILVVEDNALNIKLFCDLLAAHGHETEPVTDSRDALDAARKFKPDLVITDIQLPYVTGIELMEMLRADADLKDVPIMAVTAYAAVGDDERIRAAGASAYVSKPISVMRFAETVDQLLEGGRVVDASAEQGEDFLVEMLDTDEGARRLGEIGIGTNYGIATGTKEILLDEKIGGTVHMAIGMAYPESGGTNSSAVHWDMVCDLRRGGSISVDGEELQRDGKFLV